MSEDNKVGPIWCEPLRKSDAKESVKSYSRIFGALFSSVEIFEAERHRTRHSDAGWDPHPHVSEASPLCTVLNRLKAVRLADQCPVIEQDLLHAEDNRRDLVLERYMLRSTNH